MRFMHGGAQYLLRTVRQHLSQTFDEQWMRRGGPVDWPARSPDLNPLEFWQLGHLKALVCLVPIIDLEVLQKRVENTCREIRMKPDFFERVRSSLRQRAESCVEMHGNHTKHRPYLSRHEFLNVY
jgi:hypothetical protein